MSQPISGRVKDRVPLSLDRVLTGAMSSPTPAESGR